MPIRIRRKFVKILSLKIPPHLKYVATLPCEISRVLKASIETTEHERLVYEMSGSSDFYL